MGGCVVEWYSNYTHIPGEPTIPPKSPLLTYQDACMSGHEVQHCCTDECQDPAAQAKGGSCESCDWRRKNPWRAPGSAPVFSPCGFDGGNPQGCPVGHPGTDGCGGGGYGHGPDGRSFPGNREPTFWQRGKTAEVSWGFAANHGGGYSYRLCPKPKNNMDLTEECFQQSKLMRVRPLQDHSGDVSQSRHALALAAAQILLKPIARRQVVALISISSLHHSQVWVLSIRRPGTSLIWWKFQMSSVILSFRTGMTASRPL